MVLGNQSPAQDAVIVEKPWWNRPLIGQYSLTERIIGWFTRLPIPEEIIKLHAQNYRNIQTIAHRVHIIDDEKFGNKEFLAFVKIQFSLRRGQWGYPGFEQNIELLKIGMKAHKAFLGLEKVEFGFQGSRLGEMYDFVASLCLQKVRPEVFQRQIRGKFPEVFGKLKTEEGRQALQLYVKYLEDVSAHHLSLNLLYAFRQYKMHNYAIFKSISDIVLELKRVDLLEFELLKTKVILNFEVFESLGKVLGIPESEKTLKSYTKMLQYVALTEKYSASFAQFQQMVSLLEDWKKTYENIVNIRQEYSANKYKIIKDFRREIPGVNLYQKYCSYFE